MFAEEDGTTVDNSERKEFRISNKRNAKIYSIL